MQQTDKYISANCGECQKGKVEGKGARGEDNRAVRVKPGLMRSHPEGSTHGVFEEAM